MYSPAMEHRWELCIIVIVLTEINPMHLYIDTPPFEVILLKVGLTYICVQLILWLNVSSHRSFSPLSANLLLAVIPSPLSITDMPSRTSMRPVYSRVIKNLVYINIPISVLSVVLRNTHWQPEKHLITVV